MNSKIAAIIIPGKNTYNNDDKNGEIDILLFSEDNIYFKIKTDDEFMVFKDNIEKNKYKVTDSSEYHIDHIKDYLRKEFTKEIKTINLDRFTSPTSFALYKILASAGNIVIINSEYIIPMFLPNSKKISKEQIDALNRLSQIIDSNEIQSIFINSDFSIEEEYNGGIQDIIGHISERKVSKY